VEEYLFLFRYSSSLHHVTIADVIPIIRKTSKSPSKRRQANNPAKFDQPAMHASMTRHAKTFKTKNVVAGMHCGTYWAKYLYNRICNEQK
jgi:hypothetical protein